MSEDSGSDQDALDLVVAEAEALRSLAAALPRLLPDVVDELLATTGKVVITGVGPSGAVARRMAHLFSVCGTPSFFLHPADGTHGGLGALTTGDTLVALSKGGDSDEVNVLAARAAGRGARVVALTTRPQSPLARHADVVVTLPPAGPEDPGGIVAMGSTLVVAAFGDAVALTLMRRRRYAWRDVLFSHPGGAVGKRAEDAS